MGKTRIDDMSNLTENVVLQRKEQRVMSMLESSGIKNKVKQESSRQFRMSL